MVAALRASSLLQYVRLSRLIARAAFMKFVVRVNDHRTHCDVDENDRVPQGDYGIGVNDDCGNQLVGMQREMDEGKVD